MCLLIQLLRLSRKESKNICVYLVIKLVKVLKDSLYCEYEFGGFKASPADNTIYSYGRELRWLHTGSCLLIQQIHVWKRDKDPRKRYPNVNSQFPGMAELQPIQNWVPHRMQVEHLSFTLSTAHSHSHSFSQLLILTTVAQLYMYSVALRVICWNWDMLWNTTHSTELCVLHIHVYMSCARRRGGFWERGWHTP